MTEPQTEKPSESLIARIRKLMALADKDRNDNEAEASAAALKVQELLQQYNLTMEEVGGTGEEGKTEREKELTERRAGFKWQVALMAALSESYFCLHFVETRLVERRAANRWKGKRKSTYHVLIGRPVNIQTTISMYDYLSRAILRHCKDAGFDHGSSEANAFFDGAVSRLSERLAAARRVREEAQREEVRRRSSAGGRGGIVLADYYSTEFDLNRDMRFGLAPGTTAQKRREREMTLDDPKVRALREKYEAEGHEWVKAFFMAHGHEEKEAERLARDFHRRQAREERAEERRASRTGFSAGRRAGDRIGLDAQIAGSRTALADKRRT